MNERGNDCILINFTSALLHYNAALFLKPYFLWSRMTTKAGIRPDEGLMMMQELDDRLKEQIDKLEHLRLTAVELRDNLSEVLWALLQ